MRSSCFEESRRASAGGGREQGAAGRGRAASGGADAAAALLCYAAAPLPRSGCCRSRRPFGEAVQPASCSHCRPGARVPQGQRHTAGAPAVAVALRAAPLECARLSERQWMSGGGRGDGVGRCHRRPERAAGAGSFGRSRAAGAQKTAIRCVGLFNPRAVQVTVAQLGFIVGFEQASAVLPVTCWGAGCGTPSWLDAAPPRGPRLLPARRALHLLQARRARRAWGQCRTTCLWACCIPLGPAARAAGHLPVPLCTSPQVDSFLLAMTHKVMEQLQAGRWALGGLGGGCGMLRPWQPSAEMGPPARYPGYLPACMHACPPARPSARPPARPPPPACLPPPPISPHPP